MPRPTPSKTVRQALINYSDDHKDKVDKEHNRSRSRSKDKDKRPQKPVPQRAQRPEIKTRDQGAQPSRNLGLRKSFLKDTSPRSPVSVPSAKGETPLQLADKTPIPSTDKKGAVTNNVTLETLVLQKNTQIFQPADPRLSKEGSLEGENVKESDIQSVSCKKEEKSTKSVLSQIKSWIVNKPSYADDKDRSSTAEEVKNQNVAETADDEVQHEESPIANLLKRSADALPSIESLLPDQEANTILRLSDKDPTLVKDVVVDVENEGGLENAMSNGDAGESISERPGRKRRKHWFTPAPQYSVPLEMKDGDKIAQTRFIQKVFAVYLLKALAMLTVTHTVYPDPQYREFLEETLPFHYIAVGFYFVEKVTVRFTAKVCRNLRWLHFPLLLFEIIALCDIALLVLVGYLPEDIYQIATNKILYAIAMTSLYFLMSGFFVTFDMRDQVMFGAALIITAVACIHQVIHNMAIGVHPEHFDHRTRWYDEMTCTTAALVLAECIIMVIMWDLRRILTGHRIPNVAPKDWLITSIYLI